MISLFKHWAEWQPRGYNKSAFAGPDLRSPFPSTLNLYLKCNSCTVHTLDGGCGETKVNLCEFKVLCFWKRAVLPGESDKMTVWHQKILHRNKFFETAFAARASETLLGKSRHSVRGWSSRAAVAVTPSLALVLFTFLFPFNSQLDLIKQKISPLIILPLSATLKAPCIYSPSSMPSDVLRMCMIICVYTIIWQLQLKLHFCKTIIDLTVWFRRFSIF